MVTPIENDTTIYPMLAELKECLCAALGDETPCFCDIVYGIDVPTEYVGDCEGSCGAAYVRVISAFPTENPPEPLQRGTCNNVMAYSLAVGVLRCVSVGEEDGGPVDPDEFRRVNLQLLSDMKAIRRAIQCCFGNAFPEASHYLGSFQPLPTEGGVAGGEWPLVLLEAF